MPLSTPDGYYRLDETNLPGFLAGLPAIKARLGGEPAAWRIREVGDGNLNLVFLIDGPAGSVCVKQALPYVRAAGESWPLPLERTFFEAGYLKLVGPHVGRLVPALYHYDPRLYCIVMERLSPHIILRKGLVQGQRYPRAACDVAEFIARTAFFTSDLHLPLEQKMASLATFAGNTSLVRITSELVFADPYRPMERNRWTSPQLDGIAAAFRADGPLKIAASRLGHKFLSDAQCLIHGDLHTGSVMVAEDDTRIIDAEFAFFGPAGFDLGAFAANLLINYFAQDGHASAGDPRDRFQAWLLAQLEIFWTHFRDRYLELWREAATGDAYPSNLFEDPTGREALEGERMRIVTELFGDMVGFAAIKMIRRILGFAHNIDFEWIADPDRRAQCETRALRFARTMLLRPGDFNAVADVVAAAQAFRQDRE